MNLNFYFLCYDNMIRNIFVLRIKCIKKIDALKYLIIIFHKKTMNLFTETCSKINEIFI